MWSIRKTFINYSVYVSTVFLGVDHGMGMRGPVLFETMVFGLPREHVMHGDGRRSTSRQSALDDHEYFVNLLREEYVDRVDWFGVYDEPDSRVMDICAAYQGEEQVSRLVAVFSFFESMNQIEQEQVLEDVS